MNWFQCCTKFAELSVTPILLLSEQYGLGYGTDAAARSALSGKIMEAALSLSGTESGEAYLDDSHGMLAVQRHANHLRIRFTPLDLNLSGMLET